MKKLLSIAAGLLSALSASSQPTGWLTPYESSGHLATSHYNQTIEFCKRLDDASKIVTYTTFGTSPEGRVLPLLIVDREGFSDPKSIRASGRAILLIEACIHAGESEGKDAGMMLIRDLVLGMKSPSGEVPPISLLDKVSVMFIPIFNVDGHERFGPRNRINQNGPTEMGWRVTSNNLNLNRDFVKADTPEMQAWLRLFNDWMPDFFVDTHTTDGADYQYVVTYQMEIYGSMDPGLTSWARDRFLPIFRSSMERAGFPVFPYVDFRNWHDPRSGLTSEPAPPMLSQGYAAYRNRPGLLIETHMLKPYRQRVEATYQCLVNTLEIMNREHAELKTAIANAEAFLTRETFLGQPYPLQFNTSMTDSVMVDFMGVEYTIEKSDLTGGDWFKYSRVPVTFKLPYFSKNVPSVTAQLPYAYVIPVQWSSVISRLELHGVKLKRLETGTMLTIASWRFSNPKWQGNPYEGRHPLTSFDMEEFIEERWFPAGSVVVETMQPAGRLIPMMLEPKGAGSFLYWGFFDAVFEQKEYGESYVMEPLAREMLANDPKLKAEFENKKRTDPNFMKNSWEVTNWFYNRSPYKDIKLRVYPIGKITNRDLLRGL